MFSGNKSYTPANIQLIKFKSVGGGLIQSLFKIRAQSWFLQCGWRGKDFGYFYFASVCEDLLSQIVLPVLQKRPQATQNECFFWGMECLFVSAHRNGAVNRFKVLTCSWMLQRSRLMKQTLFFSFMEAQTGQSMDVWDLARFIHGHRSQERFRDRHTSLSLRHVRLSLNLSWLLWTWKRKLNKEREIEMSKYKRKHAKLSYIVIIMSTGLLNWIHDIY